LSVLAGGNLTVVRIITDFKWQKLFTKQIFVRFFPSLFVVYDWTQITSWHGQLI
jgi:hypothetical protein